MDINELESFKLSDAVDFHKELNPKLWEDEKLDPEVRNQLLLIAEDFVEYLGINNLKVRDVTISGSNAAYSYTPHSDLDLHVLVDFNELPNNEVYQELFTAKKTLYNDAHDITVRDVPVELYVQDTNNPVQSLGEYSIVHDKWIRIPKKRRANFDQAATKLKYEKLGELIELAIKSKDPKRVNDTIALVKRYRKSGLDKAGEFGPENLAYKAVRKQGLVQALHDLKAELHGEKLSIEEGGADTSWYDDNEKITLQDILELTKHIKPINLPIDDNLKSKLLHWDGNPEEIERINQVTVSNQFPILVIVDEQGQISGILDGNHRLHKAIRSQAKTIPAKLIKPSDLNDKARRVLRIKEQGISETADKKAAVLKIQKHLNKKYGANLDLDGKLGPLTLKSINKFMPRAKTGLADEPNKTTAVQGKKLKETESKPTTTINFRTWQKGGVPRHSFVVVRNGKEIAYGEVSKDNEWDDDRGASVQEIVVHSDYRRKGFATKIYNEIERKFNYKLHPSDDVKPDGQEFWKARGNLGEASGYIPSAKEKNDPRFKTALTVDVKPDANKKNAAAFGWKVSRAGIPPQARPDGKIK
jgi:ribosomal protein S18 acetylase RimI-like enzyme